MKFLLLLSVAVLQIYWCNAFHSHNSKSSWMYVSKSPCMSLSDKDGLISTRTIAKSIGAISLGFTLSLFPDISIKDKVTDSRLPSPYSLIQPANADVRAQQKRTYFRFTPKLTEGLEFYSNDLKIAIEKGDWPVIEKVFESYVTKYNPNDKSQVDSTDTFLNAKYVRPMTVLAGSFAERAVSPKQTALMEQEIKFETAMKKLENCVKPLKGEGFFAADIPVPKGKDRIKQAKDAYAEGQKALSEYVNVFNDGLMLELNKLDGPK